MPYKVETVQKSKSWVSRLQLYNEKLMAKSNSSKASTPIRSAW